MAVVVHPVHPAYPVADGPWDVDRSCIQADSMS